MTVKKIGIVLPNLATNQFAYHSILHANNLLISNNEYDVVFFYEDVAPAIMRPLCATMHMYEMWNFNGMLITTTLNNTKAAITMPLNIPKIFYVLDLEWLRGKSNFIENVDVYRSPNIKLVARSEDHAKMIKNYSNRNPDAIIENFNLEEFINGFYS